MDYGYWNEAQYEISRFILSIGELKGDIVYIQALAYLTECFYELNNTELSRHFANRTLIYDPKNRDAKYYLN